MNILLAIIVLSVIIIAHEFGHFIIAKANGVTVLEFSLGFGPKLLHFKKGETEYCLKLLPFGGACMMLGEDFLNVEAKDDDIDIADTEINENTRKLTEEYDMNKSFASKSVWARISIVAAGPIFNFIFAFIMAIFIIGNLGYDPCTVDNIAEGSPAYEAGLQVGDEITNVNGHSIFFEREFSFYQSYHSGEVLNITYERDGEKYKTTVTPEHQTLQSYMFGITIKVDGTINSVGEGSAASNAGLLAGDIIKTVDGNSLEDGTKLAEYLNATNGSEVLVGIVRNNENMEFKVTPTLNITEREYLGFDCYGVRVKASPMETIEYSFKEVMYWIRTVIDSIKMMFTGQVTVNDLSGPVGTVSVMGDVVEQSREDGTKYVIINLLNLALIISANLGVMNLLPIPALDGGRLVFLIIEVLRGKPVSKEKEGMVHFIGMMLLFLLMIFVMFKDIRNLFI